MNARRCSQRGFERRRIGKTTYHRLLVRGDVVLSRAFTLVEVMMGVGVMAIMLVSLYGAMTFGFAEIRLTRENVRAAQILQQKMEMIRLLNWDQVSNLSGYIPASFKAPFYSNSPTNMPSDNFVYTGTVSITTPAMTEAYKSSMRQIKVQVTWKSGNVTRTRQMTTFVTQFGMQNYVY